MTRVSTALVSFGPKCISPWGDETSWRVSGTAQLVENNQPYWIMSPTLPALHNVSPAELLVSGLEKESVVESLVLLMAAWFGGEEVLGYLIDTHNVETSADGSRAIAPFYELTTEVTVAISRRLSGQLKLGITFLDDTCLIDDHVIDRLRTLGFTVEVFMRSPQSAISQ